MAKAQLDFNEEQLDKKSDLFQLYDRLYKGMVKANEVDPPELPAPSDVIIKDSDGNPLFNEQGEPVIDLEKQAEINSISADFSTILRKNSAYLFANSILTVLNGGGAGGGTSVGGFVSRSGDTMQGALSAWYGFDAGVNGIKVFEVSKGADEQPLASVYGTLKVQNEIYSTGVAHLDGGVAFGANRVLYLDNDTLYLSYPNLSLKGGVNVNGTITLGAISLNDHGIFNGANEYYHAGNSNKVDVDWSMADATVSGQLQVMHDATIAGKLSVQEGFVLAAAKTNLLYSEVLEAIGEDGEPQHIARTVMGGDLRIVNGHGIQFDDNYIVYVRNHHVVSVAAPGMILNLGDSDHGQSTEKISLQSDIYEYTNNFKVVTKEGAGNFVNGIRAQSAVNGGAVLESFRSDTENTGVLFPKQIRFGSTEGPAIFQATASNQLTAQLPYIHGDTESATTERLHMGLVFQQTTSPFRDNSLDWSATLHFTTDGEFFAFDKPVESDYFAIKSDKYHTRLVEGTLFFDEEKFIEGVTDGLRYAGNGYFDGNLSSPSFASGFAGYGWAIKQDLTHGGFHATYDTLTVRKKMRIYELEVQKNYSTNGALWVSDSCSGDEVIAIE